MTTINDVRRNLIEIVGPDDHKIKPFDQLFELLDNAPDGDILFSMWEQGALFKNRVYQYLEENYSSSEPTPEIISKLLLYLNELPEVAPSLKPIPSEVVVYDNRGAPAHSDAYEHPSLPGLTDALWLRIINTILMDFSYKDQLSWMLTSRHAHDLFKQLKQVKNTHFVSLIKQSNLPNYSELLESDYHTNLYLSRSLHFYSRPINFHPDDAPKLAEKMQNLNLAIKRIRNLNNVDFLNNDARIPLLEIFTMLKLGVFTPHNDNILHLLYFYRDIMSMNDEARQGNTLMHWAVLKKRLQDVIFLSEYRSLNVKNAKDETPLHLAVNGRDIPMTQQLLLLGARISEQDGQGNTPLHLAILNKNLMLTRLLANRNVPNVKNNDGLTCKDLACLSGQLELFDLFNVTLAYAVKNKFLSTARKLALTEDVDNVKIDGKSLLFWALTKDDFEMVTFLIDIGANVNLPDPYGNYPLHLAARNLNRNVIESLLQHGAEINKTNKSLQTALHIAASSIDQKSVSIAGDLINARATINATDNKQQTPLHLACGSGHAGTVALLLKQGALIDATTVDGSNPATFLVRGRKIDKNYSPNKENSKEKLILLISHNAQFLTKDLRNISGRQCGYHDKETTWEWIDILIDYNILTQEEYFALLTNIVSQDNQEYFLKIISTGLNVEPATRVLRHAIYYSDSEDFALTLIKKGCDFRIQEDSQSSCLDLAIARHKNVIFAKRSKIIATLLMQGEQSTDYPEYNDHLLQWALYHTDVSVVAALLEMGFDINMPGANGQTALHLAAKMNDPDLIEFLLQHGAKPDIEDNENSTPLEIAAAHKINPKTIQSITCLVHHGASIGNSLQSTLEQTIKKNDYKSFLNLLELGINSENLTAILRQAICEKCDERFVITLIERGCDLQIRDEDDRTLLDEAIDYAKKYWFNSDCARYKTIAILLSKGVVSKEHPENVDYPLHWAVRHCNYETIEALLTMGFDINSFDQNGQTALHIAVHSNRLYKKLIIKGANITLPDSEGQTPLHIAARHGYAQICDFLIKMGSKRLLLKDNRGWTPLHWIVYNGHLELLDSIEESQADKVQSLEYQCLLTQFRHMMNIKNTPLHRAIEKNDLAAVQRLIAGGAHVNGKNHEGKTPLYLAVEQGSVQIVKLLCKNGARQQESTEWISPTYKFWQSGPTNNPLWLAYELNDLDIAGILIRHNVYVDRAYHNLSFLSFCGCADPSCQEEAIIPGIKL